VSEAARSERASIEARLKRRLNRYRASARDPDLQAVIRAARLFAEQTLAQRRARLDRMAAASGQPKPLIRSVTGQGRTSTGSLQMTWASTLSAALRDRARPGTRSDAIYGTRH
jgi:hypothetical protein